jgi:diadenylate cyclase
MSGRLSASSAVPTHDLAHSPPSLDSNPRSRGFGEFTVADRIDPEQSLRAVRRRLAPGTALRDGLERILRGNTGALVVLGNDRTVASMSTGGFDIDVEFSATRLRELAKMDGAVIINEDATVIHAAAVQLLPDPTIPTDEQGTRHRTADRVAKQSGFPVVSVSKSMRTIALYHEGRRIVLEDSASILSRANQAIATLERYKQRLDQVSASLSAMEIEDLVTVRDVSVVMQRLEMVRRIAFEIDSYVVELGVDGRLLSLQLEELIGGVESERRLLLRDYMPHGGGRRARTVDQAFTDIDHLDGAELIDLTAVARAIGFTTPQDVLEQAVSPRGHRLLARVPRLPEVVVDRLADHFGNLQKLLAAGIDDLLAVEGVGEARARSIRESLSRLAEASILERYA